MMVGEGRKKGEDVKTGGIRRGGGAEEIAGVSKTC
jgi:hypothetical protein